MLCFKVLIKKNNLLLFLKSSFCQFIKNLHQDNWTCFSTQFNKSNLENLSYEASGSNYNILRILVFVLNLNIDLFQA